MLGERTQREAEVLVDIQCAGDVLLVVGAVLRFVRGALYDPAVHQKLSPLIVAVSREQGIVEIE